MNIPRTPFSTRLSGSAKETELRLRNIFQWKKKRPPVIVFVLVAVLMLGICGGLIGFSSSPRKGTLSEIYPEYFAGDAGVYIIYEDKADEGSAEPVPGSDEYAAAMEYLGGTELRAVWGQKKYIGEFDFRNGAFYLTNETNEPLKLELYPDGYMVISKGWGQTEDNADAKVYRAESFDKETFLTLWVPPEDDTPEPESSPEPDITTVAPISGTALSPDGAYEVRLSGVIEGVSTNDLDAAEFVQICDTQTGNVLWQGDGAYGHAVVWSPNGKRVALARTTRTGCTVTIIETIKWTAWNVDLPEHTYLPDHWNWIEWTGPTEFHLTMGRGGDAGEEITYYFGPEDFPVAGISEGSEHAGVQVSPTPEPTPEPEPAGPRSSDPGWVLLTFADGTYREGWSSHDDVDTEAAAKGGTRLIFHVKEEELEWASSVEHQKATVRFGASEWEHPGELFYSSDRKALEFVPTHDDSRVYFYYKQLVSLFYQQSERSVNRQFVLDYVDAMFAEGKTELWAFLFPGTGPIAANLDEYRYEVRSVFMNYEWTLETGSEPQRENSHDDWTMYLENDKAAHIANRTNSNWVRFTIPGQGSVCYSHDGEPGSLSNALLEIFGGPSFRLARVYIPIEGQDDQTLMETYEAKFREQYLASSAITDYRLRELSPITVPDGAGGSPFFLFSFSVKPVNPSWGDWKNYAVGEDGWVDFSFEISLSQGGYENDSAWMCGYWQWHNDKE